MNIYTTNKSNRTLKNSITKINQIGQPNVNLKTIYNKFIKNTFALSLFVATLVFTTVTIVGTAVGEKKK